MDKYEWKDLKMQPHYSMNRLGQIVCDGVSGTAIFPNGFGVSVIGYGWGKPCNSSKGFCEGLYELAVLREDGKLCFDSGITDDTIGYLTREEVVKLVNRVAVLKKRQK